MIKKCWKPSDLEFVAATLLSILSQMLVVSLLFSLRIQIGVIKMFPMQMSAILGVEVKLGFSRKNLGQQCVSRWHCAKTGKRLKMSKKQKKTATRTLSENFDISLRALHLFSHLDPSSWIINQWPSTYFGGRVCVREPWASRRKKSSSLTTRCSYFNLSVQTFWTPLLPNLFEILLPISWR